MSDALTDIARDERRSRCFVEYLNKLTNYLEKPSKENYQKMREAGEDVDSIPRGYWGGRTNVSQNFNDFLRKLHKRDITTWSKLLNMAQDSYSSISKKLYELSPLSDKIIINVNYGTGFCTIKGDFEGMIHNKIRNSDFKTFDCDKYNIILPKDKLEKAIEESEVVWLRCGISDAKRGPYGPRDREGNFK